MIARCAHTLLRPPATSHARLRLHALATRAYPPERTHEAASRHTCSQTRMHADTNTPATYIRTQTLTHTHTRHVIASVTSCDRSLPWDRACAYAQHNAQTCDSLDLAKHAKIVKQSNGTRALAYAMPIPEMRLLTKSIEPAAYHWHIT